jgi:hypothetical protein
MLRGVSATSSDLASLSVVVPARPPIFHPTIDNIVTSLDAEGIARQIRCRLAGHAADGTPSPTNDATSCRASGWANFRRLVKSRKRFSAFM